MKKILLGLSAFAMLFATSCTNEVELLNEEGKTATVSFKVSTPEIASRAYSDGETATCLQYAVYDANGNELTALTKKDGEIKGSATVSLDLATGKDYSVIFWAAAPNAPYTVDFENKTMTVEYNGAFSNDEKRDAFYAYKEFTVDGANTQTVKLERPFAQLNIGTNDYRAAENAGFKPTHSTVKVEGVYSTVNLETGKVEENSATTATFGYAAIPENEVFPVSGFEYVAMNYLLVSAEKQVVDVEFSYAENVDGTNAETRTVSTVPVQRNYRTNIYGSLLTSKTDINVDIEEGYKEDNKYDHIVVSNADEFKTAFTNENVGIITLEDDIVLGESLARSAADPTLSVGNGKTLVINLNGKKLSATSTQISTNYNMFVVRGTLTVKNGTIEYEHKGENMGWNNSTNIFHLEGGVLNLEGVTAKNLGGSDMGFVAHLNNWSDYDLTLNIENSTLESNYVAVRVFNSGPRMNNVTIKNSTLKGGSYAFWVHNYTAEDFGTEAKAEAQKALLNLSIYNQGNTFSPDVNGIRYGFTNSIKTDALGITKVVSEDGTEVTLGSIFEDGLVRRGVAGTEENETIKKVVVGEGIATLYDRTFRRFYALETVELPSTLTTIGAAGSGVFQSCTNLKNIVLPESLTVLGKGTFQECSSLESINIPAGVTRIESDALRATGLKEVEFHAGVTYFGAQAFRDCKQLTKVVINAPEFTMEGNTFGIMAAPFTPMTIEVANAEMKAYVESKLTDHAKTYITVVAPDVIDNTADLQAALAEGKNVVLANDFTNVEVNTTAPYGNNYGVAQNGGIFDGQGFTLDFNSPSGDNYGIMTSGGTIKNMNISGVFRGIMIMYPQSDIVIDNVIIDNKDVCYPINTGEAGPASETAKLIVSNSTLAGWTSFANINNASFTHVTFKQGTYYDNVFGRLVKPYVDTIFENCEFNSKFYIDLSALGADQKVTLKNCTVNGVKITAENWTSLVAPEDTCGEGQISVELKNGTYLTADNLADYIIFE